MNSRQSWKMFGICESNVQRSGLQHDINGVDVSLIDQFFGVRG